MSNLALVYRFCNPLPALRLPLARPRLSVPTFWIEGKSSPDQNNSTSFRGERTWAIAIQTVLREPKFRTEFPCFSSEKRTRIQKKEGGFIRTPPHRYGPSSSLSNSSKEFRDMFCFFSCENVCFFHACILSQVSRGVQNREY